LTDLIFIGLSCESDRATYFLALWRAWLQPIAGGCPVKRIVVLGAGFAGLRSAVGAARELAELNIPHEKISVTVVNRDRWHSIRVRNYEPDLSDVRVPLDDVLGPIGVDVVIGEVTALDLAGHTISCRAAQSDVMLPYELLVFCLGSELSRPPVPGLAEHGFDVDTYDAATKLASHLSALPSRPPAPGRFTAVVVGGGLTGVEASTELVPRLRKVADGAPVRVVLADHAARIGSSMGDGACAVIEQALRDLGIETRAGVSVTSVDERGVELSSDERIAAATTVWCAGMRAHPLAAALPGQHDRLGRVAVDRFLKVEGLADVFAAGDSAAALVDGEHPSVMSCQHARPMGRVAGHNVVCDLVGEAMIPIAIDYYVTILDLGAWGALYTEGWDRRVSVAGPAAKPTKQLINCQRIYPPRSRDPQEILAAAIPAAQPAPPQLTGG
jgi:NADH dehydrogenase